MNVPARQEPIAADEAIDGLDEQLIQLLDIVEKACNISAAELGYQVAKHRVSDQLEIPDLLGVLVGAGLVQHWTKTIDMYALTPEAQRVMNSRSPGRPEDESPPKVERSNGRRRTTLDSDRKLEATPPHLRVIR